MKVNRRAFIGGTVAATAGLSGCSAVQTMLGEDESDGGGEETDEQNRAGGSGGDERQSWFDRTETVEEHGYLYWDITFEEARTISWEFLVREGPDVDVFFCTAEEFGYFEDEEGFRYWGETMDTHSGEDSVTVDAGDYYFVIDNSERAEAEPPSNGVDDPAEVEVATWVK